MQYDEKLFLLDNNSLEILEVIFLGEYKAHKLYMTNEKEIIDNEWNCYTKFKDKSLAEIESKKRRKTELKQQIARYEKSLNDINESLLEYKKELETLEIQ